MKKAPTQGWKEIMTLHCRKAGKSIKDWKFTVLFGKVGAAATT